MAINMYAWAHAAQDRRITVTSVSDYHNEVSDKTPSANGAITTLAKSLEQMKRPAPFIFIWKPEKSIPASLFTSLKSGDTFSFDLKISDTGTKSFFAFNFYECKFLKSTISGGNVKVEATYTHFDQSDE